jgi:uncharacterized protein YndB with AHSA1/START domain
MEFKTKIEAIEGKQDLLINRAFNLPVELLFKAYIEPEIFAKWMNTNVIKLECKKHGSYQFETTDPMGNIHSFNGTFHEVIQNKTIIRTFEMENTPFPVQIEYLEFEKIADNASKLNMHIVYKTAQARDQMLKLPFAQGLNMAHNRIQEYYKN